MDMRADLVARAPALLGALAIESDPLNKLLEVCVYREMILRQRVNDAAKGVMIAYAWDRTAGRADGSGPPSDRRRITKTCAGPRAGRRRLELNARPGQIATI